MCLLTWLKSKFERRVTKSEGPSNPQPPEKETDHEYATYEKLMHKYTSASKDPNRGGDGW